MTAFLREWKNYGRDDKKSWQSLIFSEKVRCPVSSHTSLCPVSSLAVKVSRAQSLLQCQLGASEQFCIKEPGGAVLQQLFKDLL